MKLIIPQFHQGTAESESRQIDYSEMTVEQALVGGKLPSLVLVTSNETKRDGFVRTFLPSSSSIGVISLDDEESKLEPRMAESLFESERKFTPPARQQIISLGFDPHDVEIHVSGHRQLEIKLKLNLVVFSKLLKVLEKLQGSADIDLLATDVTVITAPEGSTQKTDFWEALVTGTLAPMDRPEETELDDRVKWLSKWPFFGVVLSTCLASKKDQKASLAFNHQVVPVRFASPIDNLSRFYGYTPAGLFLQDTPPDQLEIGVFGRQMLSRVITNVDVEDPLKNYRCGLDVFSYLAKRFGFGEKVEREEIESGQESQGSWRTLASSSPPEQIIIKNHFSGIIDNYILRSLHQQR